MKKFIQKYIDQILVVVAALFVGLIVWFFVDSTAVITTDFSEAISPPTKTGTQLIFNIDQIKKLDLKGLGQ
jgi:hypothetical protein